MNTQQLVYTKEKSLSNLLRSHIFFPFGLDILNYEVVFSKDISAMACTDFERIYINPKTEHVDIETDVEAEGWLSFLLLHEVAHIVFMHDKRKGSRDDWVWGFATDFMINLFMYNLLNESQYVENKMIKIPFNKIEACGILFNKKFSNMTEEEIYSELLKKGNYKKEEKRQSLKDFFDQNGIPSNSSNDSSQVKITKSELEYDGKTYKQTKVIFPPVNLTKEQKDKLEERTSFSRSLIQNSLLSRGLESSDFKKFLKTIFNVKIDWKIILADAILTELQKCAEMEWSTPRLSWLVNPSMPYLPNYAEEEKYGTVVISIDESGSMTDEDVSKAVNIIKQSREYFKNIYVIKHDVDIHTKLYDVNELDENELLQRKYCGGTSFKKVFEEIESFGKKNSDGFISLCVFITDMCADIEETQHRLNINVPRIFLVPKNVIKDSHKNVIGKIIEVS